MRILCVVLIGSTIFGILTAGAANSAGVIRDADLRACVNEGAADPLRPLTEDTFREKSEQEKLSACIQAHATEAMASPDLTRLEDIWFTLSAVQVSPEIIPDQEDLMRRLEQAGWSELIREIDAALAKKDVTKTEELIRRARTDFYDRLSAERGPREAAGRYPLPVGTLWTEYRHGQERLLVRLRGTFKGEQVSDPCLRITNVAILDETKTVFRKGKNVRGTGGGNPGVGVGGAIGGGSRSGVGGGVGVSVDLTSLFGGGGDGRVARIFRMTGAQGPINTWFVTGTFRNHCGRSKEVFSVPLVPTLNQDQGGITIDPPFCQKPLGFCERNKNGRPNHGCRIVFRNRR